MKKVRMEMGFGSGQLLHVGDIEAEGTSYAITLTGATNHLRIPGFAGGWIQNNRHPYWLADALPDAWGERVMLHEMRKAGLSPRDITVADRLAYIGNSGLGCWRFHPAHAAGELETVADLAWLRDQIARLMADQECSLGWMTGSLSLGGARPKFFVDLDAEGRPLLDHLAPQREWILKFPGPKDGPSAGRWEYVYTRLAHAFGVPVPECRLIKEEFFAVRRFDVSDGQRFLMRSLASLNEAPHEDPLRNSYETVLDHLGTLCGDLGPARQVLRLALFNHLMMNWDDHAKNITFLMDAKGGWRIAPFYDITYNLALGAHAMALNGTTMPTLGDFAETFAVYGFDRRVIAKEAYRLEQVIRDRWDMLTGEAGIPAPDARRRKQEILDATGDFVPL